MYRRNWWKLTKLQKIANYQKELEQKRRQQTRLFYRVLLQKLLNLICAFLNVKLCIFKNHLMKFGQLIVRKIIKIVAIRFQILRLKCTEIDLGCGSAPYPAGSLQRPQNP